MNVPSSLANEPTPVGLSSLGEVRKLEPHGFTAQYLTIALALRITLVEYFERVTIFGSEADLNHNSELEARRLTIVLLTAALLESCINTALALSLPPDEFKEMVRRRTRTLDKWAIHSKRVNPAFTLDLNSPVGRDLEFIFKCRNSFVHAKAEVYSETDTIHPGDHGPWADLSHERVLPLVNVPVTLLQGLCSEAAPLVAVMCSGTANELRLIDFATK